MKLSIVIPVYNEANTIRNLVDVVIKSANALEGISSYELVVVDDGSKDGTRDILERDFRHLNQVRIFMQPYNQGKGAAVRRGFQEVSGDIVLIKDADMEYDPQDYKVLLSPILQRKADVVFGSRFKGETTRILFFWHMLGNNALTFFSNMLTNLNLSDMETCYKVFRTAIVKNMTLTANRFGIEPELTAKVAKIRGIRIYEVPISYYGRTYDEGKKIGWRDGIAALWFIFKFNILTSYEKSFKVAPKEIVATLSESAT